jgi:hypothetical protein
MKFLVLGSWFLVGGKRERVRGDRGQESGKGIRGRDSPATERQTGLDVVAALIKNVLRQRRVPSLFLSIAQRPLPFSDPKMHDRLKASKGGTLPYVSIGPSYGVSGAPSSRRKVRSNTSREKLHFEADTRSASTMGSKKVRLRQGYGVIAFDGEITP